METSKWIDMFDLDKHVDTIRECYKKRRAVMLETLAKELPEPCTFTRPEGGLFAWVVLPEYMDAKELQFHQERIRIPQLLLFPAYAGVIPTASG